MKKVFSIFLAVSIFVCSLYSYEFQWDLISSTPVEYRDIKIADYKTNPPGTITYEQMVSDVKELSYILQAGYSGYEDMLALGFNESDFEESVINSFNPNETVDTRQFYKALCSYLKDYINDAHFSINHKFEGQSLCTKKIVFWSDTYLVKTEDSFYIFKSNNPELTPGTKYTDSLEHLYYYPVYGQNCYRVGLLEEYKDINTLSKSFNFEDKIVELKLQNDGSIQQNTFKYHDFETKNSAYICINYFTMPSANDPARKSIEILFDKFGRCGKKYNNKKNIILDLRHNQGGDLVYPATFFYMLYNNKDYKDINELRKQIWDWCDYIICPKNGVYSPVSEQARFQKYTNLNFTDVAQNYQNSLNNQKSEPQKQIIKGTLHNYSSLFKKSKFRGKIIVLIDRATVSAGEMTIFQAKKIFGEDNVYVIGENSYGMSQYWDLITLALTNSQITVHTAFRKPILDQYTEWAGEGVGIYPDYWSTGKDLNETIYLLTQDDEMKAKLKDIEFRLQ